MLKDFEGNEVLLDDEIIYTSPNYDDCSKWSLHRGKVRQIAGTDELFAVVKDDDGHLLVLTSNRIRKI